MKEKQGKTTSKLPNEFVRMDGKKGTIMQGKGSKLFRATEDKKLGRAK